MAGNDDIPDAYEGAYRRLAVAYASAVDRRDGAALLACFAPGGELVGAKGPRTGDQIAEIPAVHAKSYMRVRHEVLNQTCTPLGGDRFKGETYCNASHLFHPEIEANTIYVMAIRYEDELVRVGDELKFARRRLHLDWTEKRAVLAAG
jgi:hypothetical protein